MLSVKTWSNHSAAAKYYSHGDHYDAEGHGIWTGEAAKELGLHGNFNANTDHVFHDLLKGVLPNGQVLGRKSKDGIEHRPGIDMTFSCPKSFSIQMLIFADNEQKKVMEVALMKATDKTLKFIESQGYTYTRKGYNGTIKENIHKLAFAKFMHTTNRNLEPQAHVHCFLANVGKSEDKKYRSLIYDNILGNVKLFGQIWRNELALELQAQGFELRTTILSDGSSSFELANIDQKLIEGFSSRRQEIEAICKRLGIVTKEGRDKVVINSRKAKQKVSEVDLKEAWNVLANKIQKEHNLVKSTYHSTHNIDGSNNENSHNLRAHILLCIEDVINKESIFPYTALLNTALKYGLNRFGVEEVMKEIKLLEKEGILIRKGELFTSKNLIIKEKQILKFAGGSKDQSKPVLESKYFQKHYDKFVKRSLKSDPNFAINQQQTKALKYILESNDKIVMMEGLPGVGKSTILNGVRDISGKKMISLIGFGEKYSGLAPTASASITIEEKAKIESFTIHSFLKKYQGYIEGRGSNSLKIMQLKFKKTIIFVDEASLISTTMMHSLLTLQDKFGFRIVLTGDTKQLGSVEAGKPFEQMLGILPSIKLDTIVRQKQKSHKKAIIATSRSEIRKSFAIHEGNIIEAKNGDEDIIKQASSLFLSQNRAIQDKTLLISPTRKMRDNINLSIIDSLKKTNLLKGSIHKHVALQKVDLGIAGHNFASFFKVGDILRFNRSYKNGIEKNDYLKIKKVNQITNSLILEKGKKELLYQLKPLNLHSEQLQKSKYEIFQEKQLELQEGLKIIFTKNVKQYGLVNSESAIINKIEQDKVKLTTENSGIKTIPIQELKHIDYGYCITIHASQGKTYDNTIAAIGNNKLLNNQKSWLVAISRHKNQLTAIVEDKNRLESDIARNSGAKTAALDLMQLTSIKESSQNVNRARSLPNTSQDAIVKNVRKQLEVQL